MNLPKIFLDSGDPEESKKIKKLLGLLDGQTTNPTLVARHPDAQKFLATGKKLTEAELLNFYKEIVTAIGKEVTGPISVEVYADWGTPAETMLQQARDMNTWGNNIQIKFPTIPEGLKAANQFVQEGGRVNMTLVFTQVQAAAVYSTTLPAKQSSFVSPFVGRWYDRGYAGMDLLANIIKMYREFNQQIGARKSQALVLASSIRNMEQFYDAISLGTDLITVPFSILSTWAAEGKKLPEKEYVNSDPSLKPIEYKPLAFETDISKYEVKQIEGDLLDAGVKRFVADWKSLLS